METFDVQEYIIPGDFTGEIIIGEKLIRCRNCKYWRTGIAYTATGRCQCGEMPQGLITNKNFYCGNGVAK